ncbi:MAG TPA: substrate-binding domain-containing protein [Candidatus Hydrogenedentes bacterium]|nr:substrate-binding domain-containing protein [Candidatus Hydrogenedentota bacterium]
MRVNAALMVVLMAALMLAHPGCESRTGTSGEQENFRFTMVLYGPAGNPFWTKVVKGIEEMGEKLACSVDIQYANNDAAKQNDILETAIANKVDGIGMCINLDDAYDEVITRARKEGIPVVAFNIDDTKRGEGNARMAYIGQDMETAGYIIATRLVKEAGLKAGDFVACPVEYPEAIYAVQRYTGVKRALDEAGIKSEMLNSGGTSLEDSLNRVTQYLLGHPETDAVCAMGGMPMEVAPQAIVDAGLKDIPVAGFDLTRRIAQNILEGKSLATIDQQPFYQGAMTLMQLYYCRKYGLHPCDVNTGGTMVDKTNAARILDLADSVR